MLHDFTRDSKLQNRVQRSQFYGYSELYRYSCDEAFKNVFNLIFNLIVFLFSFWKVFKKLEYIFVSRRLNCTKSYYKKNYIIYIVILNNFSVQFNIQLNKQVSIDRFFIFFCF